MNQWLLWLLVGVSVVAGAWFHIADVIADAIGFLASIMMAYPFLRDDWIRKTLTAMRAVQPGDGGAATAIGQLRGYLVESLQAWKPSDFTLMRSALLFLAISFGLSLSAKIL